MYRFRVYRIVFVSVFMVVLAGCATSSHSDEFSQIDELARRNPEEAAERYRTFLSSTPMEQEEWQEGKARYCKVRVPLIKEEFQKVQANSNDPRARFTLLDLWKASRVCAAEAGGLSSAIYDAMIKRTEQDVEREIQPLYEQQKFLPMAIRAHEYAPMLPKDHRYALWFEQVRDLMVEDLKTRKGTLSLEQSAAMYLLYGMLVDDLKLDKNRPKMTPAQKKAYTQKVSDVLKKPVKIVLSQLTVTPDSASCKEVLLPYHTMTPRPLKGNHMLKATGHVGLKNCKTTVSYKTDASGQVTAHLKLEGDASFDAKLVGANDEQHKSFSFVSEHDYSIPSVMTDAQFLTYLSAQRVATRTSAIDSALIDQLLGMLPSMMSSQHISQGFLAAIEDSGSQEQRQERLIALMFHNNALLTDDHVAEIQREFGFDARVYPDQLIPVPQWFSSYNYERLQFREISKEQINKELTSDVPWFLTEIGGNFGLPPQDLAGQPERKALTIDVRSNFRWPWLSNKRKFRGMGAILGFELGGMGGLRLGDDYEDITTPNSVVIYEPDEEAGSFGFNVGAVAMLGRRGRRLGVFAGVKPDFTHRAIGFYRTQGRRTSLVGRLEFRRRDKSAVTFEGWWGNVAANVDNTSMGGALWIPTTENESGMISGISFRAQRDTLPAIFYGLNQEDKVRKENVTHDSAGVYYILTFSGF